MNAEETSKIDAFLRLKELPDESQFYWIGLVDEDEDDQFTWKSTGSVPEYTNWDHGEPSEDDYEYCVHLNYLAQERTWNDRPCDDSFLYALCQKGWPFNIEMHEFRAPAYP